jgi:hypothetical protein
MSLRSVYVPKEALQGESVPFYVLWDGIDYEAIRVEYPPSLDLREVFNVKEEMFEQEVGAFKVNKVLTDGYLGCVFSSNKLEETAVKASVTVTFLDSNQETMLRKEKSFTLFGPAIEAERIPPLVKVKSVQGSADETIVLKKLGNGTAILSVEPVSGSEITADEPEAVREFRRKYIEDVEINLQQLATEFPQQKDLTLRLLNVFKSPLDFSDSAALKELEDLAHAIEETDDEKYEDRLVEAIIMAVTKNVYLITLFQLFVDYFNSIGTRQVLFRNPFRVFRTSPAAKKLRLKLTYTDRAFNKYPAIDVETTLVSEQPSEIPVYKLITWAK